jgi:two-component system chemotaxis response regulator CheB
MPSAKSPAAPPAPVKSSKIKVLIVDDSQTIRNLLSQILSKDPAFEVVGLAEKPSQVEDLIKKNRPDVITLDIHMPEMDGVTLLKKLHPLYKIPTVMISSISKEEGPQVLQALESGAVDYIQKPQMSNMTEAAETLRERLKIAAKAKVTTTIRAKKSTQHHSFDFDNVILMGASTGGTEALRVVLEGLPAKIPPILIVQHIPPVFSAAFAQRLNELCPFEVREAQNGDEVKPNLVLIAPGGKQMKVKPTNGKLVVEINDDGPVNRHKPSVDYMFRTASEAGLKKMVAVILTGMGADGAREMKRLRDLGTRTIAQNEATCVVYGMPREAAAKGGVEFVLPLEDIAQKISSLCETSKSSQTKKSA